jgi:hypothetical protein
VQKVVNTPTKLTASIENTKEVLWINKLPVKMIVKSNKKIMSPTFIDLAVEMNCANKSSPPVLVWYRNIRPIPIPIREPPAIAL